MRLIRNIGLIAFTFLSHIGFAQSHSTGFLDRVLTIDGKEYRYQVYVPAQYDGSVRFPAILFLHGAGERGSDGIHQTTVGLGPAIRRDHSRFPAIVVFPQAPTGSSAGTYWDGPAADLAMASLQKTMKEFQIDRDRIYLTGLSMGGRGTWYLAYRHPELFAAVVPICGWVIDPAELKGLVPVVPETDGDPMQALTRKLSHTPVWVFHGEMDDVIPVDWSRKPVEALKANGQNLKYTEHLGLDHNSWDATFASKIFIDWLFAQRRHQP